MITGFHHVAIICSDYETSKIFYTKILGLKVIAENYREERKSYKLDLFLPGGGQMELFTFPNSPQRPSYPEALGLRHLSFQVDSIEKTVDHLISFGIEVEPVRIDEYTGKKYAFFKDPDGLPLELYEY